MTVTENEAKTVAGGVTYDLTSDAGITSFAAAQSLDTTKTAQLVALIKGLGSSDRDDLAHVVAVYAASEKDGVDRMSRVVLSGHSYGTKVYNGDAKGAVYFSTLTELAKLFPKAAAQTKHLIVMACFAGEESIITNTYRKAFPNLKTSAGWVYLSPTGAGAARALKDWAKRTDKDPTKLPAPPEGQANWALGNFQRGETVDPVALMSRLRSAEPTFLEYFAGTRADRDSHSGPLMDYYRTARSAEQQAAITGPDHAYAATHAEQAFRLRFWAGMAAGFWNSRGPAVTKGYGKATVPAFATMSRKDTLTAIAQFDVTAAGTEADKATAKRLLTALRDLDPAVLMDSWLEP
ncbi:hypothetical protein [Actinopolymorpha pittospori]